MQTASRRAPRNQNLPFQVFLIASCLLLIGADSRCQAQTPDQWIQTGRTFLTTSNLPAAHRSFGEALKGDPSSAQANTLHAITRLLLLPTSFEVSNLFSRLGMPVQGRSVYHWSAPLPKGPDGKTAIPPGVLASEITTVLKTSVIPELMASEGELARVTNSAFLLHLSQQETKLSAVDLDLADVLVSRAMLKGLVFWMYTLHSWNLDVPVEVFADWGRPPNDTVEAVLANYPHLFTFATLSDALAARTSFSNAVSLYTSGNERMMARLPSQSRLFNLDTSPQSAGRERSVRFLLQDLQASLTQPTVLREDPRLRGNMNAFFTEKAALRSLLPEFEGNNIVGGTLPDSTFGGVLFGLNPLDVPYSLGKHRPSASRTRLPERIPGVGVQLRVQGNPGSTLEILSTDDLLPSMDDWLGLGSIFAADGSATFVDTTGSNNPQRFYATRPALHPQNDDFSNRIPLHGVDVVVRGSTEGATTEFDEPLHLFMSRGGNWRSVWWSWTAPATGPVTLDPCSASGVYSSVEVFTGSKLNQLTPVARSYDFLNNQCQVEFIAEAGVRYSIALGSAFGDVGPVRFRLTQFLPSANRSPDTLVSLPPEGGVVVGVDAISMPVSGSEEPGQLWWQWTAPQSGSYWLAPLRSDISHLFSIFVLDPQDNPLLLSEGSYSASWFAAKGTTYFIRSRRIDTDNQVAFKLSPIQSPSNDTLARAEDIRGDEASLIGSNEGATVTDDEPDAESLGATVWWRFTAPVNGFLQLDTIRSDFSPDLSVFRKVGNTWQSTPWTWAFSQRYGISVSAGRTYYFRAGGWGGEWGRIVLGFRYTRF